jgi:hypothetical protein
LSTFLTLKAMTHFSAFYLVPMASFTFALLVQNMARTKTGASALA